MLYQPAYLPQHGVADVILDPVRRLIWVVATHLPAPKLQVRDAATDVLLHCIKASSVGGECPSAILAFTYAATPTAVLVNGVEVCVSERQEILANQFAVLPRDAIIVTTMYKHDSRYIEPYVEYYTAKGAHGFLLYDNNPTCMHEGAIHWPLPYWTSEAEGIHCAQSTHLAHAALLTAVFGKNAWLLNVDLDEYLHTSYTLPRLAELAAMGDCTVMAFRSQWADCKALGVCAPSTSPHRIRTAPFVFEWPQRSKYMQRHAFDDPLLRDVPTFHRGIHRPRSASVPERSIVLLKPHEGVLLHFAHASGAPRSAGIVFTHQLQSTAASEGVPDATPPP